MPSFVGLSVILCIVSHQFNEVKTNEFNETVKADVDTFILNWIYSLDRFLLATLWTIYMKVSWRTDDQDVAYHKEQLQRKKVELSR